MRIASGHRCFTEMEPPNRMELVRVERQWRTLICIDDIPKGHIGMARRSSNRLSRSQHQGRSRSIGEFESELLPQLTCHCCSRMFTGLDMATARQPKLSIL